jgi:hypothetical protein
VCIARRRQRPSKQTLLIDLGSGHFTMGGMLNGASGGPPTTGDPCRCLGGVGSGGGQAGLPASVAQSGAGSSLGTKGIDCEAAAADAGETAISPDAASNTDNTATVAMPDDFVLQRIPSLLSARNLGLTRLTPNRRTHREGKFCQLSDCWESCGSTWFWPSITDPAIHSGLRRVDVFSAPAAPRYVPAVAGAPHRATDQLESL